MSICELRLRCWDVAYCFGVTAARLTRGDEQSSNSFIGGFWVLIEYVLFACV